MYPVLLRVGGFELRTYGLFYFLAFLFGFIYVAKQAKKEGISVNYIYDLALYIIIGDLIGARFFYIFYNFSYYKGNLLKAFAIWEGGLVFYGGAVVGSLFGIWYSKRKKLPVWKLADWIAPALALGIFIGRWGCFFNGCCFGKPTDLPWGVVFPGNSAAGFQFPGIPLHPTQLYEGFAELVVFLFLIRIKDRKPFDGFIFWIAVIIIASIRSLDDLLRYYEPQKQLFVPWLNNNHIVSISAIVFSVFMLFYLRRKHLGNIQDTQTPS